MNETKPFWQSKTIIGSFISILAVVLGFFDIGLDEASQSDIVDAILAITASTGSLLAVYGRIKAEKKIGNDQ